MRRRSLVRVGLGTTLATVFLLCWAICRSQPQVCTSEAAYESIRVGADIDEVTRLIGGPPGDYAVHVRYIFGCTALGPPLWEGRSYERWYGDQGIIAIVFQDGRVESKYFNPPGLLPVPRSFLDHIWLSLKNENPQWNPR